MGHDCSHCDRSFPSSRALEDHMARKHPDEDPDSSTGTKILVGLVALAIVLTGFAMVMSGSQDVSARETYHVEQSPRAGSMDAPVTILAFESPACSSCRTMHVERGGEAPILDRIKTDYVDIGQALYVEKFSRAGYSWENEGALSQKCAHQLGGSDAFFSLTAQYYERQGEAGRQGPLQFATDWAQGYEGVSADEMRTCIQERTYQNLVDQDVDDARTAQVSGTPTFLVVGPDGETRRLTGPTSYNSFAATIERLLPQESTNTTDSSA